MNLKEKYSMVGYERRSCDSGQGTEAAVVSTIEGSWSRV